MEKLFGEEGVIGYKNMKRDKSRYKTIVISLTTSIVLFLAFSGIIRYFYGSGLNSILLEFFENQDYSFSTYHKEQIPEIVNYLKENNLMDSYHAYRLGSGTLKLRKEGMSKKMQKVVDNLFEMNEDGTIDIDVMIMNYYGDTYNEILNKAGISELKDNEVILVHTIKDKTKFGNKIDVTNFKVGDSYTINIGNSNNIVVDELEVVDTYTVGDRTFETLRT